MINENWVMTAAHCCVAATASSLRVVAGGIKLKEDEGEEEQSKVSLMLVHEDYDSRKFLNDICLLKLVTPLEFTEFVQPVQLPEQGEQTSDGKPCTVTGWGALRVS